MYTWARYVGTVHEGRYTCAAWVMIMQNWTWKDIIPLVLEFPPQKNFGISQTYHLHDCDVRLDCIDHCLNSGIFVNREQVVSIHDNVY